MKTMDGTNVVTYDKCTGCWACSNICPCNAIKMIEDEKGFLFPEKTDSCVNCGLCTKVCPEIHPVKKSFPQKYLGMTFLHQNQIRESSSGGVFYALSEYILDNCGYVVGAILQDDYTVKHIVTNDKLIRNQMQGSKYVQSSIGQCYAEVKQLLENGKQVLFSGTPCQIAGMKSYLSRDFKNLILVEILCHGVSGPKYFQTYINLLQNKYGLIKKYMFRDRKLGMHGSNVHIWLENDKELINTQETNSFDKLYSRGYLMRESCYKCEYTSIDRCGDITLGDFWGIEKIAPNWNTIKGASVVMLNSSKGQKTWQFISDKFEWFDVSLQNCRQSCMEKPVERPDDYILFLKHYDKKGYEDCAKLFVGDSLIPKLYKNFKRVKRKLILLYSEWVNRNENKKSF